jgi:hypothetical protein
VSGAADNVARLAGLTEPQTPVPPSVLIARFCTPGPQLEGLVSRAGTSVEDGITVSRGYCGYLGGRGDYLTTGFDDGYCFMSYLGDRGWLDLPAKGDWPYVVYLRWPADEEREALCEYCEADLTVWQFDTHAAAAAFYAGLRDAP